MYRPVRMECKNLFSFQEMVYEFNQGVTELIYGENRENDSQGSNGSGKSSVLEIYGVSLTGGPLRKVKLAEIINDNADEGTSKLVLVNDVLKEELVISRTFSRKSASTADISITIDGKPVEDKLLTTESSIDEINKNLLIRVGLTKDEIYNNFILSRSRYTNFLGMSDKLKKEAINRFSRGEVVDQAITSLLKDKEKPQKAFDDAKTALSKIEGTLEVLQDRLEKTKSESADREKILEGQKNQILQKIAEQRKFIRGTNEQLDNKDVEAAKLEAILDDLDALAEEELSPEEFLSKLNLFIKEKGYTFANTFEEDMNVIAMSADVHNKSIESYNKKIDSLTADLLAIEKKLEAIEVVDKDDFNIICSEHSEKIEKLSGSVNKLRGELKDVSSNKDQYERRISAISTKLAGTITCPKCKHEFIITDDEFDVATATVERDQAKESVFKLNKSYEVIKNKGIAAAKKVEDAEKALKDYKINVSNISQQITSLNNDVESLKLAIEKEKGKIASCSLEIKQIDSKIDKFLDECFDSYGDFIEKKVKVIDDEIAEIEKSNVKAIGVIEAAELRLKDIEENKKLDTTSSLLEDISESKKEKKKAEKLVLKTEVELDKYIVQESLFLDFKTELANSKIGALSDITNDFLESVGSDLRIELSGYTKTAKGIREKISVKLLRDGVDAGSFAKFSEGEKARINLANILAMAKLININCDDNKGLDSLILDEILDSVDENGLANILATLNHLGITALVVSHGLIAEGYEYKRTVVKENGYSTLN